MKRFAAPLALLMLCGGCRAPMPSFDLLAPYGTPRVPPPATGSYGAANSYYQQSTPAPTTPTVGTGVWKHQPGRSAARSTASNQRPLASGVSQAGFETPAESLPGQSVLRRAKDSSRSQSSMRIRGMPVNDATGEPAAFDAPSSPRPITNVPPSVSQPATRSKNRRVTTGGSWQSRTY